MRISSERRTAYVYVKDDWRQRQEIHRRWLCSILKPSSRSSQLVAASVRHEALLLQLTRGHPDTNSAPGDLTGEQTCRLDGLSALAGKELPSQLCLPSSARRRDSRRASRLSAAMRRQNVRVQQLCAFKRASRQENLRLLDRLDHAFTKCGEDMARTTPESCTFSREAPDTRHIFLKKLVAFRSNPVRLSCWTEPLNIKEFLLLSLLPYEGHLQWLSLQRSLLKPHVGVVTRAQEMLYSGAAHRMREDLARGRDKLLKRLARNERGVEAALRKEQSKQLCESHVSWHNEKPRFAAVLLVGSRGCSCREWV